MSQQEKTREKTGAKTNLGMIGGIMLVVLAMMGLDVPFLDFLGLGNIWGLEQEADQGLDSVLSVLLGVTNTLAVALSLTIVGYVFVGGALNSAEKREKLGDK